MASITHPFRSAAHRGDLGRGAPAPAPFPLLRWFALLSAVTILFVSTTATLFLSRFVERASLLQSAEGMMQLVNSIVEVESAHGFFLRGDHGSPDGDFQEFLHHLGKLPGVLRANVYDADHEVLWSSDPALIGRRFAGNAELDAALAGQTTVSTGRIGASGDKPEHAQLESPGHRFVENYFPVWSSTPGEGRVIGAIELYRTPTRLLTAIERTQQRIWWGALAITALLYLALFTIVARAACAMRRQQAALVAAEKLATAGEMASAVAHGLRNPLASIRSTAELGLATGAEGQVRELLAEVVDQADRLEGWIRQFLTTARAGAEGPAVADVGAVVRECATQFASTLARHRVALELSLPEGLPKARLCPVILRQSLSSILANALEAMESGGRLTVAAAGGRGAVVIEVRDTGPGMSGAEIEAALRPFATTKPAGLGLGLPLARETLGRHGGTLAITSRPGAGTTARLTLPVAQDDSREARR